MATTKRGKRCKRKADRQRYCQQHARLLNAAIWNHPAGNLDYVPDPPPGFAEMAAGYWTMYCSELLEHRKLKGVYLADIKELCERHHDAAIIRELIEQWGRINDYENGPQLIGLDKILNSNDNRISLLKRMYGLTLDSEKRLGGINTQSKPGILRSKPAL